MGSPNPWQRGPGWGAADHNSQSQRSGGKIRGALAWEWLKRIFPGWEPDQQVRFRAVCCWARRYSGPMPGNYCAGWDKAAWGLRLPWPKASASVLLTTRSEA